MARTGEKVQLLEWSGYLKPFSIDGPFIHALVATLQLPDGHRQFGSSAPPIWKFITGASVQLDFSHIERFIFPS